MNAIKIGTKGEEEKMLQKYLGLTPDGNFGPNTDRKVRDWQKSKGLTPDGIIGPKSWALIFPNGPILSTTVSQKTNNIGISNGMINFICQYETDKKLDIP